MFFAPHKSASLKFASLKFASHKSASHKFASLKSAFIFFQPSTSLLIQCR